MLSLSSDVDCDVRVLARCCWPLLSAIWEEENFPADMDCKWADSEGVMKLGM